MELNKKTYIQNLDGKIEQITLFTEEFYDLKRDISRDIEELKAMPDFLSKIMDPQGSDAIKRGEYQENLFRDYHDNFNILDIQRENSVFNAMLGDLFYKNKYFIDLKISTYDNLVSTIDLRSIKRFTRYGYYLVFSKDMSKILFIPRIIFLSDYIQRELGIDNNDINRGIDKSNLGYVMGSKMYKIFSEYGGGACKIC